MLDAFGSSYLGKAVVATRAALPIPASLSVFFLYMSRQCSGCQCLGFIYIYIYIFFLLNLHTDIDASDTDTVTESALKPE